MERFGRNFNPDSGADVSDFIMLLFDFHSKGMAGADQAIALLTELAGTPDGTRLLRNAHKVISAQIGKIAEPKIFQAQLWAQKVTGMFGAAHPKQS